MNINKMDLNKINMLSEKELLEINGGSWAEELGKWWAKMDKFNNKVCKDYNSRSTCLTLDGQI